MINELIFMNGYGAYVLSAFSFTLLSFTVLYFVIRSQFVKEQKKFVVKFGSLNGEKAETAKLQRINRGLSIGEGEIGRAKVMSQKMIKGRCEARLELRQGKKREVRRIFRSVKIKLFSLHRVSFGSINIGSLNIGESRLLKETEIKNLKNKN